MKIKNFIIILILIPGFYACVPIAYPLINYANSLSFINFPDDINKAEITIIEPDCQDKNTCPDIKLSIISGEKNSVNLTKGKKSVNIMLYKNGALVRQINKEINIISDMSISLNDIISQPSASPSLSPTTTPTPVPTPTLTPVPITSDSDPITVISASPSLSPTTTPTPVPTPTNNVGSNGGGSGSGANTIPDIRVSGSVAPNDIGIR